MITGAHAILYSKDSDADRAFFKDVLRFPHVDVGGGWLIFGLPPSEVAVHPTNGEGVTHELYLMTDDVSAFVADMTRRGLACDAVSNQGWGMLTSVTLPGGSKLGVYQPRHASPPPASATKPARAAKLAAKPAKVTAPASKAKAKPKATANVKPTPKRNASTGKRKR
jgi:hypothetical protein